MGRSGRKKRRLQEEAAAVAGGAPLPNGQSSAAPTTPAAEPLPDPPPSKQLEQVFYEPLHNLTDDSASLTSLLKEASAAVSTGPARLADPRRALHLLRHCAPRLPPAQLADRLTAWYQFLAGLLRAPRQLWCREAACRTAARLLTEASRLEEAHRLLAAGGLGQLITPLLEAPEQATPASLHCLRVVLLHFGRGCGTQRGQLTRFLLQLFDMDRPGVSLAASRCVALLPHTGPSGTGGAAYAAAWAGQMRGLVRAAHAHLDRLLDGVVEVQTFDVPESGELELELPDLPESDPDPIQQRYRLARRVSAVCRVAALMLGSASKQPVAVPVTALLELAQRCVAAGAAAASAAMELQAARRAMYDVRAAALRMLEALILCCGVNLLQRCTAVNRLLLSALQPAAAPRPSPAAEAAHRQTLRTLRAWLLAAGAGCGLQEDAEKLVKTLAEDVRPPQAAKVTLQTNPAATNGVSSTPSNKKKRRAAADWLESDSAGRREAPLLSRPRRCQAALDALSQLVTALGPLLKVSAHQAAQQLCVAQLLELQQAVSPPPPYDRAGCRAGLYRLLRALVADPNPAWPAPLQFAVRLFAYGAKDEDVAVSMLCQDGQALCSRVVQPTHPALFFPVDLTAHSKPPAAGDSSDTADAAAATLADGGVAVPVLPCLPAGWLGTSQVIGASDDVRGPARAAGDDVPSDVSECGTTDSVRLGSRLGSVTAAAAAAAAAAGGDSRPATPPGPSASPGDRNSPGTSQSAAGYGGGRSPPEQKPAAAWLAGRGASAAVCSVTTGSVTTVNIASSESSASADGRRSVELAEMEEDQRSIVLGGSEEEEEQDGRAAGTVPQPDDEDEVEILETKRARTDTMEDEEMAPDVADMLKDFVNEDPEVE